MLALSLGCTANLQETNEDIVELLHVRVRDLNDLRQYDAAEALIDSAAKVGLLTKALADGERGCLYLADHKFRQGETLLQSALDDKTIARDYRRCYLGYAECLVANKIELHKWEEALRLAERFCSETRNSESLMEQQVSIQMYAYIGSCMIRLHSFAEAKTIGENAYQSCLEFEKEDPSSARETFFVIVTFYDAYEYVGRWQEADLWLRRALEAMDRVDVFTGDPAEYDHWLGYLQGCRSIALQHLGMEEEAAEAFRIFDSTRFSRGLGGLNAIAYLAATGQWTKIEKMIPVMDSLVASFEAEVIPEDLINRYRYQFLTYRNLGRTDKAIAVADSVFENLEIAIENERLSKALDLAALYETREKEQQLRDKDAQINFIWSASVGGILLLMVIGLFGYVIIRRRSDEELKEEHKKLVDAYNQLKVANARAEESSKMKTSFIQQISHEIRTPLNILSGFTQVLTAPDITLDEETKASASRSIVTNTNRITKLVNKMLELSDISSKSVLECTDKVTAVIIADQAILDCDIQQSPHVTFEFLIENDADQQLIVTNQRSAVRALSLLLDNARKFLGKPNTNTEGQVTLRVVVDRLEGKVKYIVEDTGIGVPPEESEHIFDEFVQLNNYYDGIGIGLTVARSLARRIGGDIVLDTSYHPGARFVMLLPL